MKTTHKQKLKLARSLFLKFKKEMNAIGLSTYKYGLFNNRYWNEHKEKVEARVAKQIAEAKKAKLLKIKQKSL